MGTTARKLMALATCAALASSIAMLAGCSSPGQASSSSASASAASASSASAASESASASATSAASAAAASPSASAASETAPAASSAASSEAAVGMANPWSSAASAEEAAKGAGLDAFPLPTGAIADLGEPFEITYSYMDGMAQARYEFPASAITVRTAKIAEGDLFDITGDYNTYANEWTETIGDVQLACAGNRKGDSTKTYWGKDGIAHSLVAEGLGGDTDFGLNTERLTVFVEAMK